MTVEEKRSVLEAREWLRRGYIKRSQANKLKARIARQRGQRAADELIEEMGRRWHQRTEWMGEGDGRPETEK
ncbi:hypothetical protein ACEK07_04915 [Alcanivoracaceae bacterium MT1]